MFGIGVRGNERDRRKGGAGGNCVFGVSVRRNDRDRRNGSAGGNWVFRVSVRRNDRDRRNGGAGVFRVSVRGNRGERNGCNGYCHICIHINGRFAVKRQRRPAERTQKKPGIRDQQNRIHHNHWHYHQQQSIQIFQN